MSIFIAAFRWQPLCYKQSPAFTQNFQKKVSFFLQKHKKNTLFVQTTASPITTTRRVLSPLVNITLYYWEKLRNCYINWILFGSPINTWTVFIPCSITDSAEKSLQRVEMCLTMCRVQSRLTKETEEWTKCEYCKKRLLTKKFKQHFMSALRKNKPTQTSGSVFAERIEKVKKTKFELQLIEIVDCFLDGHGNYDSNLVFFQIKPLQQTIFLFRVRKTNECSQRLQMVVKNEIPNQKLSSLVKFSNKRVTTCQISNQVFYNATDFKTKFSQRVRF